MAVEPAATSLARSRRVMERCDLLARYSAEAGRLTRPYGTAALRAAQETVAGWMRDAGMTVRRDAIGNLIGRYAAENGRPQTAAQTRTFLLGSHLDTVRDAGKYDGMLGVLVAIACVERLHERGERLPFATEVVAFADEEGLRFHTAYLGSAAFAGTLDPATLAARDDAGITLAEAVRAFGGDPTAIAGDRRDPGDLLGYCEVHIEQGPILETLGLPVGVVAAIAGQTRIAVQFSGEAGHAGTVPMALRRDALCAASAFVLAVEAAARSRDGTVATVGQITAEPGAGNVVPGRVRLSLDVRHIEDTVRAAVCRQLRARAERIGTARRVAVDWQVVAEADAMACDADLTGVLAGAVAQTGWPVHRLASGAGHDAVELSAIVPGAMLFVRCAGGVSHNPAEAVTTADVAVAIEVMDRFIALIATSATAGTGQLDA